MQDISIDDIETPGELVRRYQHRAKKALGQHFLVDPNILDGLIDEAGLTQGDRVLEVGAGCGTLTWMLLQRGANVTAVEIDQDAAEFLRWMFPEDRVEVRHGDVLEMSPNSLLGTFDGWYAVANLPYQVATEVYFYLADEFDRFERLVLMFQREVAERMVAQVGENAYGALSLQAQLFAELDIVQTLPGGAFKPPPKVASAALRVDPIHGTRIPDPTHREMFRRVVKQAFQRRRKILPNALGDGTFQKDTVEEACREVGIERTVRPERLAFGQFVELATAMTELAE